MIKKRLIIAGVDEVGKGALFGPVFASAVVLDTSSEKYLISKGLTDSKTLSPHKRSLLVPLIKKKAKAWSIGQASSREIDANGIRAATEAAMVRALLKINFKIDLVLVDGCLPIQTWPGKQSSLIKGDIHSPSISAASVLAKESRDSLIKRLAMRFPNYQLERHVGYGTQIHRKALKESGPTYLHRKSFLKKIIPRE